MTEYKYHSASQKWSNSINKCKFCEVPKRKASKTSSEAHKVMLNLPSPLMTEANYKCKQLPIHVTHPMWLWYMRMNYSFGAQSSFGSAEYSKKNTHPLIFSEDWLIQSSEKWKCGDKFSCAHLSRIGAHSSKVSMLSKICIVFREKKIPSGIRF